MRLKYYIGVRAKQLKIKKTGEIKMEVTLENIQKVEAVIDLYNIDEDFYDIRDSVPVPGWHTQKQIQLERWYAYHIDEIKLIKEKDAKARAAAAEQEKLRDEAITPIDWDDVERNASTDATMAVIKYQRDHDQKFFNQAWERIFEPLIHKYNNLYYKKFKAAEHDFPSFYCDSMVLTEVFAKCLEDYRYDNKVPAKFETFFSKACENMYKDLLRTQSSLKHGGNGCYKERTKLADDELKTHKEVPIESTATDNDKTYATVSPETVVVDDGYMWITQQLDDTDNIIMAGLLNGTTQEAMAATIGCSARTIRRKVKDLQTKIKAIIDDDTEQKTLGK